MDLDILKHILADLLPSNVCIASCLPTDFSNVFHNLDSYAQFIIIIFLPTTVGQHHNTLVAKGHFTCYIRSALCTEDCYVDTTGGRTFSRRYPSLRKVSPRCLQYRIQSIASNICSLYIIMFVTQCFTATINDYRLHQFFGQFSKTDLKQNDTLVVQFLKDNGIQWLF